MIMVRVICILVLPLLCFLGAAKAAIPPLSQEELNSSPYIFIGKILSISTESTTNLNCGDKVNVVLTIDVETTITAPNNLPRTFNVHGSYRQTKCKDSDLMPGPAGVVGLQKLKAGMKVKIYAESRVKDKVQKAGETMISIRHPNGLEFIKLSFGQ